MGLKEVSEQKLSERFYRSSGSLKMQAGFSRKLMLFWLEAGMCGSGTSECDLFSRRKSLKLEKAFTASSKIGSTHFHIPKIVLDLFKTVLQP